MKKELYKAAVIGKKGSGKTFSMRKRITKENFHHFFVIDKHDEYHHVPDSHKLIPPEYGNCIIEWKNESQRLIREVILKNPTKIIVIDDIWFSEDTEWLAPLLVDIAFIIISTTRESLIPIKGIKTIFDYGANDAHYIAYPKEAVVFNIKPYYL